jgi:hypothetical protein
MKTLLIAIVCILFSSFSVSAVSMFDKVNDFDGDGHADYAVTRNENGLKIWHIWRSTAGLSGGSMGRRGRCRQGGRL